ncbi:hypothetical protein ACF08W_28720 [Streptomyces sp. NPDC015144]|uniref:hypothetical protein n=1 Tax=Streptomyces sp. NPDC015144 TaxID=3364944 RepID=UPI0036FBA56C
MPTEYFPFAAARVTGRDAAGKPLPDAVLDLPAHGLAEFVPDRGSPSGERLVIQLALPEHPQLPGAGEAASHDLLLWDATPALPLRGHPEAWLHGAVLRPSGRGPGWVSLSGHALGRSFHLERQPPVPFDTADRPSWDTQSPDHTSTGS